MDAGETVGVEWRAIESILSKQERSIFDSHVFILVIELHFLPHSFLATFRSMHLKAFEDFESNAMRLLSDDASRVIYAPLIYHFIFYVGNTLNSFHFPQTRLVLKYRHSQCRLSLKVTDDKQVSFDLFHSNYILVFFFCCGRILKFAQTFTWKTDQQSDLVRVFALNEQFIRAAVTRPPPSKTFTRPKKVRPMKPKVAGGVAKAKGKQ